MNQFVPDFIQIPNQIFTDKDLTPADMFVYGLIYFYSRLKGERCFASNNTFAEMLGIGATKVSEAISKLAQKGYVEVIYEDPEKRVRKEIIPLVYYQIRNGGVSPHGEGGIATRRRGVSPHGEHIRNKYKSNKEYAPNGAVRIDSFFNASKRKEREDDGVSMTVSEFVLLTRGSQYRHIRLIGEYADERKIGYTTRGQWREFGRRNLRAARRLAPFTDRQISQAMTKLESDLKDRGGFISKWTLETLEKYLEEI